jgi:hypothetical protein
LFEPETLLAVDDFAVVADDVAFVGVHGVMSGGAVDRVRLAVPGVDRVVACVSV